MCEAGSGRGLIGGPSPSDLSTTHMIIYFSSFLKKAQLKIRFFFFHGTITAASNAARLARSWMNLPRSKVILATRFPSEQRASRLVGVSWRPPLLTPKPNQNPTSWAAPRLCTGPVLTFWGERVSICCWQTQLLIVFPPFHLACSLSGFLFPLF